LENVPPQLPRLRRQSLAGAGESDRHGCRDGGLDAPGGARERRGPVPGREHYANPGLDNEPEHVAHAAADQEQRANGHVSVDDGDRVGAVGG
jgi:hypothetical protein